MMYDREHQCKRPKQPFIFSFGNNNQNGIQNQNNEGFSNKKQFVLSLFQKFNIVYQNYQNCEKGEKKDQSKQQIKKQSPFIKAQSKNIAHSTANSYSQQSIVSSSTKDFIDHYINLNQSVTSKVNEKQVSQWNVGIDMIQSVKVEQNFDDKKGQNLFKKQKDESQTSFKVYQIFGICLIMLLLFMIL